MASAPESKPSAAKRSVIELGAMMVVGLVGGAFFSTLSQVKSRPPPPPERYESCRLAVEATFANPAWRDGWDADEITQEKAHRVLKCVSGGK